MTITVSDSPAVPTFHTPSLSRRMGSLLYEGLLLFGIGLIPGAIGAMFYAISGQQHWLQSPLSLQIITFAIYGLYFSWFWSARGQTLPMQTWRIQVVTKDGQRLSQSRALLRFIASCLWVAPAVLIAMLNNWTRWEALGAVGVGIAAYALLALLHPQKQFWHDAISGTRLVTVR